MAARRSGTQERWLTLLESARSWAPRRATLRRANVADPWKGNVSQRTRTRGAQCKQMSNHPQRWLSRCRHTLAASPRRSVAKREVVNDAPTTRGVCPVYPGVSNITTNIDVRVWYPLGGPGIARERRCLRLLRCRGGEELTGW
jgi:hypothetical protein